MAIISIKNNTPQNSAWIKPVTAIFSDRVFQFFILFMIGLAVFDANQIRPSLIGTLESIWGMLPFFALAIAVAAGAKATGADQLIAKAFSGNPVRTIIVAGLVGGLSPFCSCGVIPLIAALLAAGVPLAPVMAFWIASPIMDPEMFIITAAEIGTGFAVAKTISALLMGWFAGFMILSIQKYGYLSNILLASPTSGCAASCSGESDKETPSINWTFWKDPARRHTFKQETASVGLFLGKWLSLAFFLETLMIAYISPQWVVDYVGESSPFAIPIAAIVGIPSYLNGYAAIPLLSGLMDIGMTPAAAMAFATAGAVSSIPAAIAVFALVRRPVFLIYLILGFSGSLMTAFLYQLSGSSI